MIQNNESLVVPFFKNVAMLNPNASKKAGRPIYKDMEVCEVRIAGDRNAQSTGHAMRILDFVCN